MPDREDQLERMITERMSDAGNGISFGIWTLGQLEGEPKDPKNDLRIEPEEDFDPAERVPAAKKAKKGVEFLVNKVARGKPQERLAAAIELYSSVTGAGEVAMYSEMERSIESMGGPKEATHEVLEELQEQLEQQRKYVAKIVSVLEKRLKQAVEWLETIDAMREFAYKAPDKIG